MTDDEYTPLIDRKREPKSRVHEDLSHIARERLSVITDGLYKKNSKDKRLKKDGIDRLMEKIGRSPVLSTISNGDSEGGYDIKRVHNRFILRGDTVHILSYIEILLNERYATYDTKPATSDALRQEYGSPSDYRQTLEDIRDVFITEGILWELEWAGEGGIVQFKPLESEAMEDVDKKIQAIAEDEPWDDALKGYNDAFSRYLDGDFDELIPKKLYNSIEAVLQTICVEEEEWTENEDLPHSDYLDMLNDHGVYDAHGVTAPELGSLLDSLEKMVAKVSDDRKQRHVYHDRAYATLLIHQVGAYLYFLINRYEQFSQG